MKWKSKALLIVIFDSLIEEKRLLLYFYLYIDQNNFKDNKLVFNSILKYSIKSKFN